MEIKVWRNVDQAGKEGIQATVDMYAYRRLYEVKGSYSNVASILGKHSSKLQLK